MNVSEWETITLGMGCFWSPDALFGHLPGVLRTRVGYAGGTKEHPTYRDLGDHTETVEVDYDPRRITLMDLFHVYWSHHNPSNINDYKGRQYQSLLLYRNEEQHRIILAGMEGRGNPQTEAAPYRGFTLAEDRHQKYYLKRYPQVVSRLSELYQSEEDLRNGTFAARLNGLAKGYTNRARILEEVQAWTLPEEEKLRLTVLMKELKW